MLSEPKTVPRTISVFVFISVFVVILTCLLNLPGRFDGLYATLMTRVSPGATGSRLYVGLVHPQFARESITTTGSSPTFTALKVHCARPSSSLMMPKSWEWLSHFRTGVADAMPATDKSIEKISFLILLRDNDA